MKRYSLLILLIIFFCSNSCTRDDICAEATQTTPMLVIEFYDIDFPDQSKSVPNLNVIAEGETEYYFDDDDVASQTSISIPLRTTESFTNYTFVRNYESEDENLEPNEDEIQFSYAVNLEYVSRACGYKAEFLNYNAVLINETNTVNWIKGLQVIQPNDILDEEDTHLYIYH